MATIQDEEALLTRIAWLYYYQGLTQEEIAKQLAFSRTKVVRLIAKARRTGLVRIEIVSPFKACFALEEELKARFGLLGAVVIPSSSNEHHNKRGVAKAAALYLEGALKEWDVIGSGWGSTLYEVGRHLREVPRMNLTLVQLMGGLSANPNKNPVEIVKLLTTRLGAKGFWLNTPAVVDNLEIKEAILSDEGVGQVFATAKLVNKAIVGIGDVTEQSAVVTCGIVRPEHMAGIAGRGAVGDILGQHFDVHGRPVKSGLEDRLIAVPLEQLRRVPMVIGVAEGPRKVLPILGALRGRYIDVLVTDENTAADVIHMDKSTGNAGAVV